MFLINFFGATSCRACPNLFVNNLYPLASAFFKRGRREEDYYKGAVEGSRGLEIEEMFWKCF